MSRFSPQLICSVTIEKYAPSYCMGHTQYLQRISASPYADCGTVHVHKFHSRVGDFIIQAGFFATSITPPLP
ncbi:hypothetical protein XELAEV_18026480mg [Xenopus laevis]|uniref:Uncharacterized protein n=1 Tax=Xenopus laevis TaxID=8355 RepID=A0A974CUG1_XENLA|nr:hypothetical protein XELAEV_18026480mg [Xenopus laevis]